MRQVKLSRERIIELERWRAITAAVAFLNKIDNMTTKQFSRGAERPEREALREALTAISPLLIREESGSR